MLTGKPTHPRGFVAEIMQQFRMMFRDLCRAIAQTVARRKGKEFDNAKFNREFRQFLRGGTQKVSREGAKTRRGSVPEFANKVTSVYGKDQAADKFNEWIGEGFLRYQNTQKIAELQGLSEFQLLTRSLPKRRFKNTDIYTEVDLVNYKKQHNDTDFATEAETPAEKLARLRADMNAAAAAMTPVANDYYATTRRLRRRTRCRITLASEPALHFVVFAIASAFLIM